ncbi:hypothetical protein A2U01_0114536, partial [Trifolium medium]|nr:hypothetical protein [Trifolium medium]
KIRVRPARSARPGEKQRNKTAENPPTGEYWRGLASSSLPLATTRSASAQEQTSSPGLAARLAQRPSLF